MPAVSIRRDHRATHLLVSCALISGCASHKPDTTVAGSTGTVRVTTNIGDVRDCRIIRHVDSRDTALGCGPTAQPAPEECLRYQVRLSGGDTLLVRGPAGEAYDCGRAESLALAEHEPPAVPTNQAKAATAIPERVAAAPAADVATPATPRAVPEPIPSVRATADRSLARGCVYLGDVNWTAACSESGACAEEVGKLGGNLVVHGTGRAEVFWCRPTP